ncbi:efflux RND transporter periplasmic adaptor subunit [Rhodopirellula baltica]|nr:efflux RND transporter periplasmic adaptor subunit [Rhodopirellula baltica]
MHGRSPIHCWYLRLTLLAVFQLGNPVSWSQSPDAIVGIARFADRAELTFGATGRIESISVKEGQRVELGEVLAKLDQNTLVAAKEEARLKSEAKGALLAAEVELKAAQRVLEASVRAQQVSSDAFASQRLDAMRMEVERLQAAVLLQTETQMIQRSAFETAKSQLLDGEIRAPFDGVIVRKFGTCGEGCSPTTPVLELIGDSKMEIEFFVPVSEVEEFRQRDSVLLVPEQGAIGKRSEVTYQACRAEIQFVDLSIQPVRKVVRVVASLPRPSWMMDGSTVLVSLGDEAASQTEIGEAKAE